MFFVVLHYSSIKKWKIYEEICVFVRLTTFVLFSRFSPSLHYIL